MLKILTGYVNSVTSDPVVIQSAGFDFKESSPVGILNPPANVRLLEGPFPGSLKLLYNSVPKRTTYKVEMSTDGSTWVEAPVAVTTRVRSIQTGLTVGDVYYFRVFTVSSGGNISGPSDPAQRMVI